LWLIAAILATLVVCTETASGPAPPAEPAEVEVEIEGVE
jgi:hypothetical protein